ncbi:MAG: M15 family metallopeptidase [Ferruginibacter sp.]
MNKIINRIDLKGTFCAVFLLTLATANAQDTVLNKYGLWVIENAAELQKTIHDNPNKEMTDLKKKIPNLVMDLRYVGSNNFMHQILYPFTATSYLRKPAVDSLLIIQKILNQSGLALKIFDAYRPYSVTEKMWELVHDDLYTADPKNGSGHNRGAAVDLTLVNLATSLELNMGTGYDNFSDTAHHAFTNLPEEVLQNRLLLKKIMELHGFKAFDTEWWHYSLSNTKEYELMNVSFKALAKKRPTKNNKPINHANRTIN